MSPTQVGEGLAGSVRPLVGESRSRPYSFTLIDLPRTGPPRITALAAPNFRSPIPLEDLPVHMARPDGPLTRLDQESVDP